MTSHKLAKTIRGKGSPVVLIHGFLASSHYFCRLVPLLNARNYQTIALDLLGSGKSPKPRIAHDYATYSNAILRTLQSINISKFTLVGHSMGALISLDFARRHPEKVERIVLFNPPIFENFEQADAEFRSSGRIYQAFLYSPWRKFFWRVTKIFGFATYAHHRNRAAINLLDIVRTSHAARATSYKNIILNSSFFYLVNKVSSPITLIVGAKDRAIYRENLKKHKLPSNVKLKIVDSDHHLIAKSPELACSLIAS